LNAFVGISITTRENVLRFYRLEKITQFSAVTGREFGNTDMQCTKEILPFEN
jgi:hypothetical protein